MRRPGRGVLALAGIGVVGLVVIGIALVSGFGSGPTGTVKLISVGEPPDPLGTGRILGMTGVMATYEVTGPTRNAVVVCKFAGLHSLNGGQSQAPGWVVYKLVVDLKAGETTRDTCDAFSITAIGDEAPSQPVISITTMGDVGQPPANWQTDYVPPTPWPAQ
jgi:hypothetical protein